MISNLSNDKRYLAHADIYDTKILKRDAYNIHWMIACRKEDNLRHILN